MVKKRKPKHKIIKQTMPSGEVVEIVIPNPEVFVWEAKKNE